MVDLFAYKKWLSVFMGLFAASLVMLATTAPAEANRVPPRPQPPQPQPQPAPDREPVPRTYVFAGMDSYPNHQFVLSHRRSLPRTERVDFEAQRLEANEPVELHFTDTEPRRAQSLKVRLHFVNEPLPKEGAVEEDAEAEELLSEEWLDEHSLAVLDVREELPATAMFMNQEIRAETITYRLVVEETRDEELSLRIYRSRAERYDEEGNLLFARDYGDPERSLRERRAEEDKHAGAEKSHAAAEPYGAQGALEAGMLLLLSSFAGLMLIGLVRLRRDC